jgi:hypothetical protein
MKIVRTSSAHATVRLCRSISDKLWLKFLQPICNETISTRVSIIICVQLFKNAIMHCHKFGCNEIQLQEKFALIVAFSMIHTASYSDAT